MNWQYISGFFDADGSITYSKNSKNQNKSLIVSFHNNEIDILEEIESFIKSKLEIKGTFITKRKEGYVNQYELRYSYQKAIKVTLKLKSLHSKKIKRIKLAQQIQDKTKRNGKYTQQELQEREDLVKQFLKIK